MTASFLYKTSSLPQTVQKKTFETFFRDVRYVVNPYWRKFEMSGKPDGLGNQSTMT